LAAKEHNQEKLTILVDYKGASQIAGLSNISVSKEILNILQNHYPERLGVAILFNTPWVFTLFWTILSPFINTVTKKKIFIYSNAKDKLGKWVSEDQLEEEYGGKNTFKWDFEKCRDKEDLAFPIESEKKHKTLHKSDNYDVENSDVKDSRKKKLKHKHEKQEDAEEKSEKPSKHKKDVKTDKVNQSADKQRKKNKSERNEGIKKQNDKQDKEKHKRHEQDAEDNSDTQSVESLSDTQSF